MKQMVANSEPMINEAEKGERNICILLPRGHGKAEDLETNILTETGFKKLKYLTYNDVLFDIYGNKQKIIKLHPRIRRIL